MKLFQVIKKLIRFFQLFKKNLYCRKNLNVSPPPNRSHASPRLILPSKSSSSSSPSTNPSDLGCIDILSHSSSSTLYLSRHRPTNKLYALKIIPYPNDDIIRHQISCQIKILHTTNSPFIVHCHGIFKQENHIQIILEYMDGNHIRSIDCIRFGNGNVQTKIVDVAYQILQGLAYLHRKKIIHNDIKPYNILINSPNEIKISNFGSCRFLTGAMAVCSSAVRRTQYMSPERKNRKPYDGYASDIWSFGLTVLEFYLGRFPGGLSDDYWKFIMHEEKLIKLLENQAHASEKFRCFIKCYLQMEPSERWTAQQLLNHPFITERNVTMPMI